MNTNDKKSNTSKKDLNDKVDLLENFDSCKEEEDYKKGDEKFKQNYWDKQVCSTWWKDDNGRMPIDILKYRVRIKDIETDFDRFIPGIMDVLYDLGFTGEISDIFILDEHSKEYLEGTGYLQKEQTKKKIIEIIRNKKTQEILGKNISFEELTERIGNLYYDSFFLFLDELGNNMFNEKVSLLLKQASGNIKKAWEIYKSKLNDFLIQVEKSNDKNEFKHTNEVNGLNINNIELAKTISKLKDSEISEFLEKLSEKIQKDGDADKLSGKLKLANELFACAEKLKKASNIR